MWMSLCVHRVPMSTPAPTPWNHTNSTVYPSEGIRVLQMVVTVLIFIVGVSLNALVVWALGVRVWCPQKRSDRRNADRRQLPDLRREPGARWLGAVITDASDAALFSEPLHLDAGGACMQAGDLSAMLGIVRERVFAVRRRVGALLVSA